MTRRFDRIVDKHIEGEERGKPIDRNRLKRELFMMVFTHEHAHALDRHGIDRGVDKKDLEVWIETRKQSKLTQWREHMPWITEGLAMYFEREYIERLTADDPNLQSILRGVFTLYVDDDKDLGSWPYYGYRLLEEHLKGFPFESIMSVQ
jgi:hypothetical protein